jgi:hypothetical protein
MTQQTQVISYDIRARIFWTLASASILLLGVYFFSLYATIINTVARQELESRVGQLSLNQGRLEFEYITMKNEVNMEMASQYGLKDDMEPIYVSRNTANTLTMNTRR